MAHRKEAFQSKVLRKLYPTTSTPAKDHNPPAVVDPKARTTHVKRKTSGDDTVFGGERNIPCQRMYTVLPPPPDYNLHSEKSVTLPQPESINSAEDPAEESVHESNEELEGEKEVEKRQRRRRGKRKPAPARHSGKHGAALSESSTGQSRVPVDEEWERMSKNKRRKLKKKRHKEKMMSMGLLPRAAALEFTYNKDGEEKEEEDNKRRAAELSDFLRTTTEIYMSDTSLHEIKAPHLSATVDDLLGSIASGCKPCSVLKQLCCLKALAQHSETDALEKALDELNHNPSMSAEETTAVVSLFKYWIRDILPMQRNQKTRLSTVHP
ncbi:uncharacterized protein erich1 [Odontesthes bonariensis]|uniref:uncharacterized protein erich1 n=1 Tax=Odontesthes bonariensis TaxID=219752 RepID=UPI003F5804E9